MLISKKIMFLKNKRNSEYQILSLHVNMIYLTKMTGLIIMPPITLMHAPIQFNVVVRIN